MKTSSIYIYSHASKGLLGTKEPVEGNVQGNLNESIATLKEPSPLSREDIEGSGREKRRQSCQSAPTQAS